METLPIVLRRSATVALFLFALIDSTMAPAMIPALPVDGFDVAVTAVHSHYRSEEAAAGGRLYDSESGALDGCQAEVMLPLWGGYALLGAQREFGGLAYQGSTQTGIPVQASTQLIIEEYSAGWAHALLPLGPVALGARVEAGVRRIDRAIGGTAVSLPLHEVLEWPWLRLGLSGEWPLGARLSLSAMVFGERGLGRDMLHVDFGSFASPVDVMPAARYGAGASLLARYHVDPHWSADLWAETSRQRYGASPDVEYARNGSPAGQARYPGSTQWLDTLGIDLAYRF